MQRFWMITIATLAMVVGCRAEECVPLTDIRDLSGSAGQLPDVRAPAALISDTPDSPDVRAPAIHPVTAHKMCIASVFDRRGETFVELPSGATRKLVGTTFVKTAPIAHRNRSASATGPIHIHTEVAPDQRGVIATIVDSHELSLSAFRFEMPTQPAVGLDGRITSGSGDPCAMGIDDVRSWRTKAGIVVSVRYSLSDLCDGRVPDLCSTVTLPTPKDPVDYRHRGLEREPR